MQNGPQAMHAAKRLVWEVWGRDLDRGLMEDTARSFAKTLFSDEGREGLDAAVPRPPAELGEPSGLGYCGAMSAGSGSLNLIKLVVGLDTVDELAAWHATERTDETWILRTRQTPKRAAELVDGGSVYRVFKGLVLCRQRILAVDTVGEGQVARCQITDRGSGGAALDDGTAADPVFRW